VRLCRTPAALSAPSDEANLIACAGPVPAVVLADRIGLRDLADESLTVPGARGTARAKVMSLVAGMLAGANSMDDLDLLSHRGMGRVFTGMLRRPVRRLRRLDRGYARRSRLTPDPPMGLGG
jgi:hypothetical protein